MRIFVTGITGWIGSALVPELTGAGHQLIGLARTDEAAAALVAAGVEPRRGTLDDLDLLRHAATESEGVIHLAFKHDLAFTGNFQGAADADRVAIETLGETLAGTDRPLVIASGTLGVAPGRLATEADGHDTPDAATTPVIGAATRHANAELTLSFAEHGVRSCVVRLPPTVHGDGDTGFVATLIAIARATGVSGYVADGSNRWPAGHRFDVAQLFRLAVEHAPAGSTLHGSAEEGVTVHDIATVIGRHLDVPVVSIAPADAAEHFTWLAGFIGLDSPASSAVTQQLLGWEPTHVGLIDDLDQGHYFRVPTV